MHRQLKRTWPIAALLAICVLGFALRLLALTGSGGPNGAPTGYDDGVYFSASALLWRGVLPYRDFIFVHPPGILHFLALVSWFPDPATGFAAARVLAVIVGSVNIALVGLIALRAAGPVAAIVGATLYALYPDAVNAERSAYLEPVLNLFALSSAFFWLRDNRNPSRSWIAGVLCGAACAVKFWGGIWVLAAIAAPPGRAGAWRTDVTRFIGGAVIAGVALLAPLALPAPRAFIEQTLRFQVQRPPDGTLEKSARLLEMFGSGHRTATVLALFALFLIAAHVRESQRDHRYFALALLITTAGFYASSSYWAHYNSHLAASQCVLAGFGAAALLRVPRVPRRVVLAMLVGLLLLLDGEALRNMVQSSRASSREMLLSAHAVASIVPPTESVFAFDPSWTLAAGRLPPHGDGAPVIVDSYGAMLLHAIDTRSRRGDAAAAFAHALPQPQVRERLSVSRYAMLGWRGGFQLNDEDEVWFSARFSCVNPEAGQQCVWQRLDRVVTQRTHSLAEQTIQYGEGWYGEEGIAPRTWRWMGARSTTTLPPRHGAGRLWVQFSVPLDVLKTPPLVTVELDGKVLDQFAASETETSRIYTADRTTEGLTTLVLTTNRTFNPARLGLSGDSRDLGLRVKRLTWRDARASTLSSP